MPVIGSYPLQGTLQNLDLTIIGPNPYPVVGDSAALRFDLTNSRTTAVSATFETFLAALATGDFAGKLASVAYLKKNGSGVWAQAPSLTVLPGETVECRADIAFSQIMDGTEIGNFEIGYTET